MHALRILPCSAVCLALFLTGQTWFTSKAQAHGTLVGSRMYQVRQKGPTGGTPATWNDTYYTWSQNSNNFPTYAQAGFSYADYVAAGTISSAGINDGAPGHNLNFSDLNIASSGWVAQSAVAGSLFHLTWVATAPHDPSHFMVYFTNPEFNTVTDTMGWDDLTFLGSWKVGDSTHPVTTGRTAPTPVAGETGPTYEWDITIPSTASGRESIVVVWQRDDPAGEAFFATQDVNVVPEPGAAALLMLGAAWPLTRRPRRKLL